MKIYNTSIDKFINYISGKDLYIYGVGDFYQRLTGKAVYSAIHQRVAGYIDNGREGQRISMMGQQFDIYGVEFLKSVSKGIVLLCGTTYLAEMYQQLVLQHLPDEIECFIMPLIWAVSDGRAEPETAALLHQEEDIQRKNRIERKIHCCWFSGEDKPEKYQKCIDTWKRVCPEYEIIEWNAATYDCQKNLFVKQAYERKQWAFVSDYARLDVVYQHGGIYIDMDVELIKNFEPLLQFEAFFNYGMRHMVELGSGFGGVRHNLFIKSLLDLYDGAAFLDMDGKPQVEKYVQPRWINDSFRQEGFRLNGDLQIVKDMLLLPRRYYTPKDDFFLCNCLQCEETRGIHHFNSEWKPQEYLEQRGKAADWMGVVEDVL